MTDWKPVNPCEGCESKCNGCQQDCLEMMYYRGKRAGQEELLEYLHPQMEYMSPQRKLIESMLKQLEASQ